MSERQFTIDSKTVLTETVLTETVLTAGDTHLMFVYSILFNVLSSLLLLCICIFSLLLSHIATTTTTEIKTVILTQVCVP